MTKRQPTLLIALLAATLCGVTPSLLTAQSVSYEYGNSSARFINAGGGSEWLCVGQSSWLTAWPGPGAGQVSWSAASNGWHNTTLTTAIDNEFAEIQYSYETHAQVGSLWGCRNQDFTLINTRKGEFFFYPSGLYGGFMAKTASNNDDDGKEWFHNRHEQGIRSFPIEWTVAGTITD